MFVSSVYLRRFAFRFRTHHHHSTIDANNRVVISPLHLSTKTLIFARANPRVVLFREVLPVPPGRLNGRM